MPIDGATTAADYTDACTIEDVTQPSGGYAIVSGNDVYMQLAYGPVGQQHWSIARHVGVGNWTLDAKATGVRFKDYTAGSHATVSADIFTAAEPTFSGTSSGSFAAATTMVTGIIASNGAITAGTGFSVVHNSTGVYTVTFNDAFTSAPVVLASPQGAVGRAVMIGTPTMTGFTVTIQVTTTGVVADTAFDFVALAVS